MVTAGIRSFVAVALDQRMSVMCSYTTVQHVLSSMTFNKRNVIETAKR